MSARLWPAKQSILPILPTTAVTARLNLNCHKLNHPTKVHLWKDQLAEDDVKIKVAQEHVLSRRKDHTIPTRWSLYRSLIRNARQLDRLFASQAAPPPPPTSDAPVNVDGNSSEVMVRDVRSRWNRNKATQGYQRVRDWLSLEYKLLEDMEYSLQGEDVALDRIFKKRSSLLERVAASRQARHERKHKLKLVKSVIRKRIPRVHPSFLAPTLFNIALPRMKPQPLSLSMMINDRIKRRDQRRENQERHRRWAHDMLLEEEFYRDLGISGPNGDAIGYNPSGQTRSGKRPRRHHRNDTDDISFADRHFNHATLIGRYFERDAARAATTYTAEMISAVRNARTKREQRRQRLAAERNVRKHSDLGYT
ncbi:hypothetical protein QFC21_001305 [Naganishia friedmannii]|uniref:Uncharacterized protein n=1 Tax=Naganishia friedmannii TaxID=89922 RepID=A0ACC2W3H2_9TREE|nr:hypothetical protein QFC21_001305 [Naganishia friedmannii]